MSNKRRTRLRRLLGRGGRAALRRFPGVKSLPDTPQWVIFEGSASGEIEPGLTLLQAARSLDVDLDHFCGGSCSCGTCRVEILEGAESLSRMKPSESIVLGHEAVQAGDRLSCQARILGPVKVQIPEFFMRGA
jgi:ferredoxin